jgi:hypothetical protein
MKAINNLIGGLAGAVALNLVHETVRRLYQDAPRVDLVGEEGVNKLMKKVGEEELRGNALYIAALSGDLLTNALYYSTIGAGKSKHYLFRGVTRGLAAGFGALSLTKKLGLNDAPIARKTVTKAMTVGYYLLGGIVAARVIRKLNRSGKRQ